MGRHWRRIKLPGLDATIHIIIPLTSLLFVVSTGSTIYSSLREIFTEANQGRSNLVWIKKGNTRRSHAVQLLIVDC